MADLLTFAPDDFASPRKLPEQLKDNDRKALWVMAHNSAFITTLMSASIHYANQTTIEGIDRECKARGSSEIEREYRTRQNLEQSAEGPLLETPESAAQRQLATAVLGELAYAGPEASATSILQHLPTDAMPADIKHGRIGDISNWAIDVIEDQLNTFATNITTYHQQHATNRQAQVEAALDIIGLEISSTQRLLGEYRSNSKLR